MRFIPPRAPLVIRLIPYFFPAFLFLSVFFSVFSPLPLLIFRERAKPSAFFLAFACNGILIALLTRGMSDGGFAASEVNALVFFLYAGSIAALLPWLSLNRKWKVESSVLGAVVGIGLGFALLAWGAKALYGIDTLHSARELLTEQVDAYGKLSPEKAMQVLGTDSPEVFGEKLWRELPSSILMAFLLAVWGNTLLWLRLNPGRIRERMGLTPRFLSLWKAPEFLVWPAIVVGAVAILDFRGWGVYAWGGLRVIGMVYVFQGLSILSFFLDLGRIRGLLRPLLILLSVFFLLPVLVVAGFLDLWFDFRSKIRQT